MWRQLLRLAPLAALFGLGGSSLYNLVDPIADHAIDLKVIAMKSAGLTLSKRLRFVAGWRLESGDADFGGLSALLRTRDGLLSVTDTGALVVIKIDRGVPRSARMRSLPADCARSRVKLHRDSESLAQDERGRIWVGFEWRNMVCRLRPGARQAEQLAAPAQMRGWPLTGGAESMTRLRDGRFVVIAERAGGGSGDVPLLIFPGDPLETGAVATEVRYRPPTGYRPTDVAELADGALLVLNRRFKLPFSFSTILSIVPAERLSAPIVQGRAIALLKPPGLNDNFEGLAVEERDGRTFLWLVSDDNFAPVQNTYLLQLELIGR